MYLYSIKEPCIVSCNETLMKYCSDDRPSTLMWESSWKVIEFALLNRYVRADVEILCEDI